MTRRYRAPECEHEPVLTAMPGHPDFVAMTCRKCGATTGYSVDVEAVREHWERGDLALPYDFLEDA